MATRSKSLRWDRVNVVGTLHEARGWRLAHRDLPLVDAVEARVDALPSPPSAAEIARLRAAAIVTVRDVAEGGVRPLPLGDRKDLYLELLPAAAAIDIEVANLRPLEAVVRAARESRCGVIASFHDFHGVPSLAKLRTVIRRARDAGADCVKIAATPGGPQEIARLLGLLEDRSGPLAVMAMGPLGRAARLLFARCGSCLNYGWLGAPQVPGQWPAGEFRKALDAAQNAS